MIKEAEIQQAYLLGRQAALEKLAAETKSLGVDEDIKRRSFSDATKGYTVAPLKHPVKHKEMAKKYDMPYEEALRLSRKGHEASQQAMRFGKALGENNSQKALGLPHGSARVPYRD